jgi:hypothetical protein
MVRFGLLVAVLTALVSCGDPLAPPSYPRKVGEGYQLKNQQVITGDRVPGAVNPNGLIRAVQLTYDASNPVQVFVFETKSASVAFEALQNFRPRDDIRGIQVERFFIEAQTDTPDAKALDAFLTEFEKQLR